MTKWILCLAAMTAAAACAKCYNRRYFQTAVTNMSGSATDITLCKEDNLSLTQTIHLSANQIVSVSWTDPEQINQNVGLSADQCDTHGDDEVVQVAARLTTASQALVHLCAKSAGGYELVSPTAFCGSGETEITATCPN